MNSIFIHIRGIFNKNKTLIAIIFIALLVIFIVKKCEDEPRIITRTETKIITKVDTIVKTVIGKPKTVYVAKYSTKWRDSIVYVEGTSDGTNEGTIKALQYETVLKGTKASANIKIVSLGEVLDVSGTFTYPEKETTTTITKTKAKSGLFIYGSVPFNTNNINIEAGVMYQFKNTIIVGVGGQYDDFSKSAYLKGTVAIRVF